MLTGLANTQSSTSLKSHPRVGRFRQVGRTLTNFRFPCYTLAALFEEDQDVGFALARAMIGQCRYLGKGTHIQNVR